MLLYEEQNYPWFNNRNVIGRHVETIHYPELNFICRELSCKPNFKTLDKALMHLRVVHQQNPTQPESIRQQEPVPEICPIC